jgi:hypothetical protein
MQPGTPACQCSACLLPLGSNTGMGCRGKGSAAGLAQQGRASGWAGKGLAAVVPQRQW